MTKTNKPPQRITFQLLVCGPHGLGYCCEYAFFKMFKRTGAIATKLGMDPRTVRYHKRAFKDGETKCKNLEKCLKGRLF